MRSDTAILLGMTISCLLAKLCMAALVLLFVPACFQGTPTAPMGAAGPLVLGGRGGDLGSTVGVIAHAGQSVAFGARIVNEGDTSATLESATFRGEESGGESARVVDVRVAEITPTTDLIAAAPWPFEDLAEKSVPVEGYVLEPGEDAQVIYVVEVDRTGAWRRSRAQVNYRANGLRLATITRMWFEVCPTDFECFE